MEEWIKLLDMEHFGPIALMLLAPLFYKIKEFKQKFFRLFNEVDELKKAQKVYTDSQNNINLKLVGIEKDISYIKEKVDLHFK